jgi:hypothetical protein
MAEGRDESLTNDGCEDEITPELLPLLLLLPSSGGDGVGGSPVVVVAVVVVVPESARSRSLSIRSGRRGGGARFLNLCDVELVRGVAAPDSPVALDGTLVNADRLLLRDEGIVLVVALVLGAVVDVVVVGAGGGEVVGAGGDVEVGRVGEGLDVDGGGGGR